MHKLLTAGVALLALGLSVPAKAADMPVKYVAPAPIFTWTGCYVGVQIGYKWGTSKHTSTGVLDGVFTGPTGDLTPNFDVNGPVGGGEAGCNYQVGNWVWGIEVDGGWASASGQAQDIPPFNTDFVRKTDERWLGTARGRLGYAADKWLWYVTGGAAWTGVDVNASNVLAAVPATRFATERHNKTGWVVGFGTEYALIGGWSVKSEWLYADFGSIHAFDTTPTGGIFAADVRLKEFIWRVGMNYRFDWASFGKGKAPVVAKY